MVPEWLAVLACIVMWCAGFLTCGAIIGKTPYWQGVRDGLTFRFLYRALTKEPGRE